MTREAPHALVHRVAVAALGTDQCFPVVQPQDKRGFPAVVYSGIGRETATAFEGHAGRARILRVDCRGKDYGALVTLAQEIRDGIQQEGRLHQDLGELDDWDETLEVHRHIITLSVRS